MDWKRAAAVTGGLAVAGALAGALVGAGAMAAVTAWDSGPGAVVRQGRIVLDAGMVGALFGVVLGPLAAWLLMRHVPIGLAIGGTALGTAAGLAASFATGSGFFAFPLAGFFLAALALRLRAGRKARASSAGRQSV